jgi:hypothetical protein
MNIQTRSQPNQFPKVMLAPLTLVLGTLLVFAYRALAAVQKPLPRVTGTWITVTDDLGSQGKDGLKVISYLPIVSELDGTAIIGRTHAADWVVCNPAAQWWCCGGEDANQVRKKRYG